MSLQYQISDIIGHAKLKPNLLFLFVEGKSDESILNNFLKKTGNNNNVAVRSIDRIDIKDEILIKHQLGLSSNRNKVIALFREIDSNISNNKSLFFLIDKDLDEHLGINYSSKYLYYTDFTCIESYLFTKEHLDEFFTLTNYKVKSTVENLFKEIKNILTFLFSVRIENEINKYNLEAVNYKTNYEFNQSIFTFKFDAYLIQKLTTKNKQSEFPNFKSCVLSRKELFSLDVRNYIHGHDFENVLFYYICLNGNRDLKLEYIQNNLRALFTDCQSLLDYKLFRKIHDFANGKI